MKYLTLLYSILLFALQVRSQEPVKWVVATKQLSANKYEIHFKATIRSGWHIYSINLAEGGPEATKIIFNSNPLIKLEGGISENGKIIEKYEDVFGVTVKYFENEVDFIQVLSSKKNIKTVMIAKITFMACNDEKCLPVKTEDFYIKLRD